MQLTPQPRLASIDNAKALGIILVVLGHIISPSYYLSNLIFSFQVPLFFVLSGYLLSSRKLNSGYCAFLRHTSHRLLIPYLLFGLILYVPWVLVFRHFGAGAGVPWYKPLLGIAYGLGTDNWLQQSPPLWFLPALFIATILVYFINKQKLNIHWPLAFLAASLGILASLSPLKLPLSAANALFAVPFMLAGVQWRANGYPLKVSSTYKYFAPVIAVAALLLFNTINGSADFNAMRFGNYGILLYVPTACLGIALTVWAASALPATRVAEWVSTGTLYILALHIPLFTLIKGVGLKAAHIPTDSWHTKPLLIILISIVAISLSLLIRYGVNKGIGLLEAQRR